MPDPSTCPTCGAPLPLDAPRGLCPACLLAAAREDSEDSPVTISLHPASPSVGAAAEAFTALAESLGGLPRILLRDTDPASGVEAVARPASPEMPSPPPDRNARLQLFGEIAHGGMGAILKGRDTDLGRDLAVKVLLERHRENPDLVRRFVEEAQIAGQLQHPGVVPVYELGALADRRPYFAMKLVKGRTLADVLAARPSPTADRMGLLATLHQVTQTVAYAHARGVIHRDLKPANVMVGGFGEVQVMDWGLAKVLPRGGVADDPNSDEETGDTVIATARSGTDADESRAGSVLGTPAYMPPEQARGEIHNVDERADVFALGSILCEVLTGSPAHVGRSGIKILDAARIGDLTDARSRLDACGADAELIALALDCLAPDPDARPRSASSVSDRLGGFLRSIEARLRTAELERAAESARAEEAQARVLVERSRRRRTMALAASLLALAAVGGLGAVLVAGQRQARALAGARALEGAWVLLNQAKSDPHDPARWRALMAAVKSIDADGLEPSARTLLAADLAAAESGLRDAERIATFRQALVDVRSAEQDAGPSGTDAAYAVAFREAGIDINAASAETDLLNLAGRPEAVAIDVAGFLDHLSGVRRSARRSIEEWQRPLTLARALDPDPNRSELRLLLAKPDRRSITADLRARAEVAGAGDLPGPTAVLLAQALDESGELDSAASLLRQIAARLPGDLWVNFSLGEMLTRVRPAQFEDSIRFYTAARVIRPETAHMLADLLDEHGRSEEAFSIFDDLTKRRPDDPWHLTSYGKILKAHGLPEAETILDRAIKLGRDSIRSSPSYFGYHAWLGDALRCSGELDEAIECYRAAIRLHPDASAAIYNNLGLALFDSGDLEGAIESYHAAIRLDPDNVGSYSNLGNALHHTGELEGAIDSYRKAILLDPKDAKVRFNFGITLSLSGNSEGAIESYRETIRLDPDYFKAHMNLGMLLRAQGDLKGAIESYRAAVHLAPENFLAHYYLGNALRTSGNLADAIASYRTAIHLNPNLAEGHCNLGLSLLETGDPEGALRALNRGHELGSRELKWKYPSGGWVKEAEQAVATARRSDEVIAGRDRPSDAGEASAFAMVAYRSGHYVASARLFGEALATEPGLAEDRAAQHRYNAACAAALAAAGERKDDPPPDEEAKARLRRQALDWLRAELAAWSEVLDRKDKDAKARAEVVATLEHWQKDHDLSGVREADALAGLPEAERAEWQALWEEVDGLIAEPMPE